MAEPRKRIAKHGPFAVPPNLLVDYEATWRRFSWETARRELEGLRGGRGLNIAHEAVDRHAAGTRRDHLAIRWLGKNGRSEDFTYGCLRDLTNRFANVLRGLGAVRATASSSSPGGSRSSTSPRSAHSRTAASAVRSSPPSAPSPSVNASRSAGGKVLVTTRALYERRKITELRSALPQLEHVVVIGG